MRLNVVFARLLAPIFFNRERAIGLTMKFMLEVAALMACSTLSLAALSSS